MIPSVGSTCKFTLIPKFSDLDGVYRVRGITQFTTAVESGVDFVLGLYALANLTRDDYNDDFSNYTKDTVLILESVVNTAVVLYVPQSILLLIPDSNIKEYLPLYAIIDLGVQENTQKILPLLDAIQDIVTASIGSKDPVRIITSGSRRVYLTENEYAELEAARQANIKTLVPLSVQLLEAQKKNTELAALVTRYEELIKQKSTS